MGKLRRRDSAGGPVHGRRRFLSLAVMAGALACVPRSVWGQTVDSDKFDRTMRSLRIWWERLRREPDAGDLEAKDATRYISTVRPNPRQWSDGGITLTWIGHSTFLINLEGTTILTDPVFSRKVGISLLGLMTVGLERFVPPALTLEDLPPIDLVLVSHAHMDHYDLPSLRKLPRDVPMILARDTTEFIDGLGFSRVQELDWGESAEVAGVRIEALPAKHWGSRYPWDRDRGYNGFLLQKHKRSVLFGGDTAYTERLPAAMQRRPPDVAMLPIGGYDPYIANHASPEQAWDLFHEIRARYLIPMHWRTFRMSHERPFEPYERLSTAVNGSAPRLALHTIGETWSLPG
ncbi:MAG TPA: MBL fold metallo-hydrolase [Candidatus Methylomirabilis sp.]|nr:MBL fold metallo-hydrolase [Candidatus Methylomirabilis sp.]